jgi:dTDP-4-dehydrorhamnose reductase
MRRLLVTGRNGQVATALAERAAVHRGFEVLALGRPELDLEQPASVEAAILAAKPDLVVNAAAYTAVDKAETESDRAFAANRDGAGAAARAARALGVPILHLSTDYVYPGDKPTPYVESDATGPTSVYGRSKLEGEQAVMAAHPNAIILRTAWVYSPFGANFVKTMLRLAKDRDVLRVVDDQSGNPTSAIDIADAILRLAPGLGLEPASGIYHLCGSGSTSWCGFARAIFAESARRGGPAPRVEAITTAEYPTPAKRPANSRLDTAAFTRRFGFALRPWPEAMAETVARLLA